MQTSRYQLVDSLYGPGTVGAWLLTICAVLISWSLDTSSRRKDTISVDFIAALLLPIVATSHLVFQIARLPVSVQEAVTSQDINVQKYGSALEAPLNICETFSMAALLLAVFCGPWWKSDPKWTRLGLVLVVGLLSWATENVMFAMVTMRGVDVADTTLSRPYLFFLTPIVTSTWGFLALCIVVWASLWIRTRVSLKKGQHTKRDLENTPRPWVRSYVLQNVDQSGKITQESMERMNSQLERALQMGADLRRLEQQSRNILILSNITGVFLPIAFLTSFFGISFSKTKESTNMHSKQFFLIPNSNGSMSNLDQILALVGGIIVLLAAVRRVYRSRVRNEQISKVRLRRSSI